MRLRQALKPFCAEEQIRPIEPSPQLFYYRNKMEFAFGGLKEGPVKLGLRKKGSFDWVVDVSECRLLSPETGVLLQAVRQWAEKEKLPTYHLKSHRGFLRYLVVREGKNTGERLVHLITAQGELPRETFLEALAGSGVRVTTALWSVHGGVSDVARGETTTLLTGEGFITEHLFGQPYRISPTTFFQTNTRGAEVLYGHIPRLLGGVPGALVDLYCGCGSIGLSLAGQVQRVWGVDVHGPSIEDAQTNARLQGVSHARFDAVNADNLFHERAFLEEWLKPGMRAVLDPPRPGLSKDVRRGLLDHPIQRWVYVSCNPNALAQDLAALTSLYRVVEAVPVDLFPHTPHVECALALERRSV